MNEEKFNVYKELIYPNRWLLAFFGLLLLIGLSSVIFLGKDNPIEKEVEKIIEVETGLNIDLSP